MTLVSPVPPGVRVPVCPIRSQAVRDRSPTVSSISFSLLAKDASEDLELLAHSLSLEILSALPPSPGLSRGPSRGEAVTFASPRSVRDCDFHVMSPGPPGTELRSELDVLQTRRSLPPPPSTSHGLSAVPCSVSALHPADTTEPAMTHPAGRRADGAGGAGPRVSREALLPWVGCSGLRTSVPWV